MGLNRKQLALVHLAKAQVKMAEDVYRDTLHSRWGVTTSKDLTSAQLEELLKVFRSLGWRAKRTARARPNALELAGPAQQILIAKLYDGIGWAPARRVGFNTRTCGAPWPQTRAQANRIIEALKAMMARGYTERPTPTEEGA